MVSKPIRCQIELENIKYMIQIRNDYSDASAIELGRDAKPTGNIVDDIWQALSNAKYKEWERSSSKQAWKLQKLKDACERALLQQHFLEDPQPEEIGKEVSKDITDQLEILKEVFNKAAEDDTPKEVPDYLCCKITLDIFRDPVITPSGITYERNVLLDHLQKVEWF
ncbi:E3 ubiquitin-protein ligase CHIP [Platanthera zijinensis]|uniref:RING-type E3 ubiquitin transferase n=1 Tax=Platanthera zijinensis TaxID=2320716 RepID=A0AAP0G246_9ASPA